MEFVISHFSAAIVLIYNLSYMMINWPFDFVPLLADLFVFSPLLLLFHIQNEHFSRFSVFHVIVIEQLKIGKTLSCTANILEREKPLLNLKTLNLS